MAKTFDQVKKQYIKLTGNLMTSEHLTQELRERSLAQIYAMLGSPVPGLDHNGVLCREHHLTEHTQNAWGHGIVTLNPYVDRQKSFATILHHAMFVLSNPLMRLEAGDIVYQTCGNWYCSELEHLAVDKDWNLLPKGKCMDRSEWRD